jgi:hypothetical protein
MEKKIWGIDPKKVLNTSKQVRRYTIDNNLEVGWVLKWGGEWDIIIDGNMVKTGLKSLTWTGEEWKEFILKHRKNEELLCNRNAGTKC